MTIRSIPQLSTVVAELFGAVADGLALEVGFVKRQRKLSGRSFARGLVFGWLARPEGSIEHLARTGAVAGCAVSAQAWQQRWSPAAAEFLYRLLEAAVRLVVAGSRSSLSLLSRFPAVVLVDSSTISLPAALAALWRGCGGGHSATDGQAAVKVSVAYDLVSGALLGLRLAAGRTHDRAAAPPLDLPRGSLLVRDRGYFSLAGLRTVAAAGNYYLSRVQAGTVVRWQGRAYSLARLAQAQRLHGGEAVDLTVELGAKDHLPTRLLLWRVSPSECRRRRAALRKQARKKCQPVSAEALALAAYHLLVTNAPAEFLSLVQVLELYAARWQIELLFKLWKSIGGLDQSRSRNLWRVLCEVYAKLLAQLCAHWFLLVAGLWDNVDRSLPKASAAIQTFAMALLPDLDHPRRLSRTVRNVASALSVGCAVNHRRAAPSTSQRLTAAAAGA